MDGMNAISATERFGTQLLAKIEGTSESLEDFLKDVHLQAGLKSQSSRTGLPALDALWAAHPHQKRLVLRNRGLALLYPIIDALVSVDTTVAVVDVTGLFSATHLKCSREELGHVHVWRCSKRNYAATLASVAPYMESATNPSRHRVWGATIVVGAIGGDICTHWNGWVSVERGNTISFPTGISVEEALRGRRDRTAAVAKTGWRAVVLEERGRGGEFVWGEREDDEEGRTNDRLND